MILKTILQGVRKHVPRLRITRGLVLRTTTAPHSAPLLTIFYPNKKFFILTKSMLIFYQCYVIILTLKLYQSILSILIFISYIIIYTYIFTFCICLNANIHLFIAYSINIHSNKGVFLYILTFNVYIWPI